MFMEMFYFEAPCTLSRGPRLETWSLEHSSSSAIQSNFYALEGYILWVSCDSTRLGIYDSKSLQAFEYEIKNYTNSLLLQLKFGLGSYISIQWTSDFVERLVCFHSDQSNHLSRVLFGHLHVFFYSKPMSSETEFSRDCSGLRQVQGSIDSVHILVLLGIQFF
jgi:hypothetical protein